MNKTTVEFLAWYNELEEEEKNEIIKTIVTSNKQKILREGYFAGTYSSSTSDKKITKCPACGRPL